jgi:hypothetical protein
LPALILLLVALHPFFMKQINRLIEKSGKRIALPQVLTYYDILTILALYNLYWFTFGFAFYFFINSFVYLPISQYFYITGSFALSTLIGFLAFFLPAGIGAREGTLILFLNPIMKNPYSTVASLASRLWMISAELMVLLIVSSARKGRAIYLSNVV